MGDTAKRGFAWSPPSADQAAACDVQSASRSFDMATVLQLARPDQISHAPRSYPMSHRFCCVLALVFAAPIQAAASSRRASSATRLRGGDAPTAQGPSLTLEAADAMADAALAEAKSKAFNAISVFVTAADGRVLVSKTMPACPPLISSIAHGKAGAAIGTHSSSRALKDKCASAARSLSTLP